MSANTKPKLIPAWEVEGLAGSGGKKRLTVKILGEEYAIRGPFSPEHMLEAGSYVNNLMQDLVEKYPRISMQKIAILASLNLASDLLTLREKGKDKGEGKQ